MQIVIIEDEPLAAKALAKLLDEEMPGQPPVAMLKSVKEAVAWFGANPQPDLVFSDIQLSDGISFEVFEQCRLTCPVVFVTAYDEYAIRAFRHNSIDYLLKPVDRPDLQRALEKHRRLGGQQQLASQLQGLLAQMASGQPEKKHRERFFALAKDALIPVPAGSIACFYKDEIIYLLTFDNKRLPSESNTLDDIEQLVDPAVFYRANRQAIVNIGAVEKLVPTYKGLTVRLKPPVSLELDISREKVRDFKAWLGQ